MKFDDMLLALIARRPSSGYDLKKWLSTEGIFLRANADSSQIYRTLARLIERGRVEFRVDPRDAAPDAKVYHLTATGARRLRELAAEPYCPPERWQEPDFMVRYALIVPFDPPSIVRLIATEIDFRMDQRARYRDRDRSFRTGGAEIAIDLDFVGEAMDDLHFANARAVDAWLAWLESAHAKWSARLSVAV